VNGRHWTSDELDVLRDVYPHLSTQRVAKALRRSMASVYAMAKILGLYKTEKYLASPEACTLRRGENVGAEYRFPKGHLPANKGLRRPGYSPGRMRETQFKKGEGRGAANRNYKPVGSIEHDHDGFLVVKVFDAKTADERYGIGIGKSWEYLHRRVWIQHRGPIPPKHHIAFKDRNRDNVAIENLECVSFADMARRNTMWNNYPRELAEAIQLQGVIKRKLRRLQP
jgi:hypothetical protein